MAEIHNGYSSTETRRPRIGLLFDTLWNDFEQTLWRGVVDEARVQDVNLICFGVGAEGSPSMDANRIVLNDLIGPQNVDGILVISGTIGAFMELPQLREHLARFRDLPIICLSSRFDDFPCALVDNRSGMRELVTHFIEYHGRRRIAFIAGPETNFDAQERLAAYKEVLAQHEIPFDSNLIVYGDFSHASGGKAVLELVKERKLEFDTLIAANDHMALNAMHVLKLMGKRIPEDLIIGGFDDARDTRAHLPLITTVHQPTYELGRQALIDMTRWLRTGEAATTRTLPTRLAIRGSCGCSHNVEQTSSRPAAAGSADEMIGVVRDKLAARFVIVSDILNDDGWARRLIESYLAEYRGETNAFRATLEAVVTQYESKPIEPSVWGEILHHMFGLLDARLPGSSSVRDNAFLYVNQYTEMRQIAMYAAYTAEVGVLQRFQQPLSSSFDKTTFKAIVQETLPLLDINGLWLMLYEDTKLNTRGQVYPMLQFQQTMVERHDAQVFDAASAPRLPAYELIPGGIPRDGKPWLVNVIPLFFEQEQFGFAVFEIGNSTRADAFEIVNSHLTSIIQGFRLLEETRHYTSKLEQDVAARTADLQSKNREIEKLNEELVHKNRTDLLTNLYTRGAVFDFLKRHFSGTRRMRMRELNNLGNRRTGPNGQTFSVLMCDVDHFKRINDAHGHLIGDQVLRTIGELMNASRMLRQEDIAGRFGGEEFIVVLTNTDAKGACRPANRFMKLLKEHTFKGKNDEPFKVTVSIGISELHDEDPGEEAVIQRADQALYYAKNNGRNRVVVYEGIGAFKNCKTK